jgi:hypothetical protein
MYTYCIRAGSKIYTMTTMHYAEGLASFTRKYCSITVSNSYMTVFMRVCTHASTGIVEPY